MNDKNKGEQGDGLFIKLLAYFLIIFIAFWLGKNVTHKGENESKIGVLECTRKEPYPIAPEFERALSLFLQRFTGKDSFKQSNSFSVFRNCLDIHYADLRGQGIEGLFYFDSKSSSIDHLVIEVDNSYKNYDDLLTAFLLAHEVTHASHFVNNLRSGKVPDCVQEEVDAFLNQIFFLLNLNQEEVNSLASRLPQDIGQMDRIVSPLQSIFDLVLILRESRQGCGISLRAWQQKNLTSEQWDCYYNVTVSKIREMVESNPYYQKQCGL